MKSIMTIEINFPVERGSILYRYRNGVVEKWEVTTIVAEYWEDATKTTINRKYHIERLGVDKRLEYTCWIRWNQLNTEYFLDKETLLKKVVEQLKIDE